VPWGITKKENNEYGIDVDGINKPHFTPAHLRDQEPGEEMTEE